MRPLSIRATLTASFVALVALLVAAFSATLYLGVGRTLRSGLDAVLRERAEKFVALTEWDEDFHCVALDLLPEQAAELETPGPGRGVDVWAWPGRELLHRSGVRIEAPLPEEADVGGAGPWEAFERLGGSPPRRLGMLLALRPAVEATPMDPAKPPFDVLVRVTESLQPVESQLAEVGWVITVLAGVSMLVVLAFGLLLSRRFVRPLQDLQSAAAEVRAGRRAAMPRRGSDDEIDSLAAVLDEAFSALQASLDRQSRFTSNAAHELRNPIAVIRNAAEVALRRDRTAAEYRGFLSDARAAAERMASAVEALLLLARMDAGVEEREAEPVDLLGVVRESAAAQAEGADRIRVESGSREAVSGDPRLIRILVDNLLSNALRHSTPGTPVDVAISRENGSVHLTVGDHGPGIPAAETRRVFERFHRGEGTGAAPQGAGLGLAIVDEVARAHSASCRIESSEAGTRVTVSFEPDASQPGA